MFVFVIIKVFTRLVFLPRELELDISVFGRFEDFSKGSGAGVEGGGVKKSLELTVSASLYPRASVEVESLISAIELLDDRCEVYNS